MKSPTRTRKTKSGEKIREVFVGEEWKIDARPKQFLDIKEIVKITIIILASLGFFKGGEIAFNSFSAEQKFIKNQNMEKAMIFSNIFEADIKERKLTTNDILKHIDKSSEEYKQIHMSLSQRDDRYVKKNELEKITNQQKELIEALNSIKTTNAVLARAVSGLERAIIRLDSRIP